MLFYGLFRQFELDKELILRLVRALILAGLAVSVIGLFLFVTKESVITAEGGSLRLASVYGSPNNVGLLLGRIIPFVLAYWLLIKQHRLIIGGLLLMACNYSGSNTKCWRDSHWCTSVNYHCCLAHL